MGNHLHRRQLLTLRAKSLPLRRNCASTILPRTRNKGTRRPRPAEAAWVTCSDGNFSWRANFHCESHSRLVITQHLSPYRLWLPEYKLSDLQLAATQIFLCDQIQSNCLHKGEKRMWGMLWLPNLKPFPCLFQSKDGSIRWLYNVKFTLVTAQQNESANLNFFFISDFASNKTN